MSIAIETYFAPAGRASPSQFYEQQMAIIQEQFISEIINTFPDMMLVLNNYRQIVAVNITLLKAFGVDDPSILAGLRYGEAVKCIHSAEGPDGCGTSEHCSVCGAVLTILSSQESGKQVAGECRLTLSCDGGTSLDLEVQATPVNVAGIPFTLFALKDIASDKRRNILERTFFHDVLNTIGGIKGIADILADSDNLSPEDEAEYKGLMVDLSENLAEEIAQQRRLMAAENGDYIPLLKRTDLAELLQEVCKLYVNHIQAPNRKVVFESMAEDFLITDSALLRRVVGNMVLNALEAIPDGEAVKVSIIHYADEVEINVTNSGEMPKNVQLNMFKRSFSTKSLTDRGIGTYSMKLFGERYLGGSVGFRCENGLTTFFIKLPVTIDHT